MKEKSTPNPPGASLNIKDILLSLFKHKWKILILSVLGFGAAAAIYVKRTPIYESSSKLLVRYVLERNEVDSYESKQNAGGRRGSDIIRTEIEILTSLDLAAEVAESIGPERLLKDLTPEEAKAAGSRAAAGIIARNLKVSVGRDSNVLKISYLDEDPPFAQEILTVFLTKYKEKHLEIHRSGDALDSVMEDLLTARNKLVETSDALNNLKQRNRIVTTLTETYGALESQITANLTALTPAQADLVAQEVRVKAIEKSLGISSPENDEVAPDHGEGAAEGAVAEVEAEPVVEPGIPLMEQYRSLSGRIASLRNDELALLGRFTEQSSRVVIVRKQIKQLERERRVLVSANPRLEERQVLGAAIAPGPQSDLDGERASLRAFAAKVALLQKQFEGLNTRYDQLFQDRPEIERLERELQAQSEKFQLLTSSHDKATIDQALNPSNIPNIITLQNPSPPAKTYDPLMTKIMYGLAVFGIAAGVGLALLFELVLDGRVKQPLEIETRLRMPLLLSIPYMSRKQRSPLLVHRADKKHADGKANGHATVTPSGADEELPLRTAEGAGSPVPESGFLLSYATAIRDRLVYYFELNDLNHKPKLVALTGFTAGAGTSTLAAGVARAFADEEETKVLLVDMNSNGDSSEGGSRSSSSLGKLDVEDNPLGRNLFVATASSGPDGKGSRGLIPKNFYELIPKFRASEFDYIIFDMPPLGPTSPTFSMAGFMDQVLLVLDAENTNSAGVKRAHTQLLRGKADVTCIFNKTRRHAPRWVQSEV